MAQKASVYTEKGAICNADLLIQLEDTVLNLKSKMKASTEIFRGERKIGFGVSKAQRGIAADAVISVVRAIKSLKGW